MKKIVLVALLVLINSILYVPVSAADKTTEAIIKEQCSGYSVEGEYAYGYSCKDGNEVLFINNKQVPQASVTKELALYKKRGALCTETINSENGIWPKGFSASCKKGEYAKYTVKGKVVSRDEFTEALEKVNFRPEVNGETRLVLDLLNSQKKVLKSYQSFIKAFEGKDRYGFISQYVVPKVGSDCSEGERILINKTGYEVTECIDGKIVTIDYYWQGKKMTLDKYLKAIYKSEKSANAKTLKELNKKR
jgi:hypothetical protein